MINRENCIHKLKTCKDEISKRFGVHSMKLFGSVARGEQKESSDVDVCVEMEPKFLKLVGLKRYLEEYLGCSVDVIRRHNNLSKLFVEQIDKDGVFIF